MEITAENVYMRVWLSGNCHSNMFFIAQDLQIRTSQTTLTSCDRVQIEMHGLVVGAQGKHRINKR